MDVLQCGVRTGGRRRAFSVTYLNVDVDSDTRGVLKTDVKGVSQALELETGWGIAVSNAMTLSTQVRVGAARFAEAAFTDAVNARVSFPEAGRLTGGIGFATELSRAWTSGGFSLRGSLDVERIVRGGDGRRRFRRAGGFGVSNAPDAGRPERDVAPGALQCRRSGRAGGGVNRQGIRGPRHVRDAFLMGFRDATR